MTFLLGRSRRCRPTEGRGREGSSLGCLTDFLLLGGVVAEHSLASGIAEGVVKDVLHDVEVEIIGEHRRKIFIDLPLALVKGIRFLLWFLRARRSPMCGVDLLLLDERRRMSHRSWRCIVDAPPRPAHPSCVLHVRELGFDRIQRQRLPRQHQRVRRAPVLRTPITVRRPPHASSPKLGKGRAAQSSRFELLKEVRARSDSRPDLSQ